MIGAGIVERCDTVEEFPHLGFVCRLADNRKDRLLQGSRHSRHTGWGFSGKRLTIEFSFAGNDDVGALDFGAQLDRFRDHLEARSHGGAAKGEKPKAKAARCTGPRDIAVVVVKYSRRNFCQARKGAFEGLELLRGGPFLCAESSRRTVRTQKRISYVAGGGDAREREIVRRLDAREIEQGGDRAREFAIIKADEAKPKRARQAETAVIGCASAKADDDLPRAVAAAARAAFRPRRRWRR